jgi:hypothetical protein
MHMPEGSSASELCQPGHRPLHRRRIHRGRGTLPRLRRAGPDSRRFHGSRGQRSHSRRHSVRRHLRDGLVPARRRADADSLHRGQRLARIFNLGLYAVSLFDKHTGQGVRVAVETDRLHPYPSIREWLFKLKPKKEQDSDRLREEIRTAGSSICSVREIALRPEFMGGRGKGAIAACPSCGQAYPARDGSVCRSCRGESPYVGWIGGHDRRELASTAPGCGSSAPRRPWARRPCTT